MIKFIIAFILLFVINYATISLFSYEITKWLLWLPYVLLTLYSINRTPKYSSPQDVIDLLLVNILQFIFSITISILFIFHFFKPNFLQIIFVIFAILIFFEFRIGIKRLKTIKKENFQKWLTVHFKKTTSL